MENEEAYWIYNENSAILFVRLVGTVVRFLDLNIEVNFQKKIFSTKNQ